MADKDAASMGHAHSKTGKHFKHGGKIEGLEPNAFASADAAMKAYNKSSANYDHDAGELIKAYNHEQAFIIAEMAKNVAEMAKNALIIPSNGLTNLKQAVHESPEIAQQAETELRKQNTPDSLAAAKLIMQDLQVQHGVAQSTSTANTGPGAKPVEKTRHLPG